MKQTRVRNLLLDECAEARLVEDASVGNADAFDALLHRHSDRVFRLALRMLDNREDTEDVRQETFVRAYQKLRTFRMEASFGTWIYSIAVRLCLSRRRSNTKRPVEELTEPDLLAAEDIEDPGERVIAQESARKIQKALSELAPPDRLLIVLKFVDQKSHEEIAEVLGCSVESSRSRLARAKRLFITRYERTELPRTVQDILKP